MIHRSAAHKYRRLIVLTVILTVGAIVPQRSLSRAAEQQSVIISSGFTKYLIATKERFTTDFEIMPCVSWRGMTSR
jgi:hypothetical protein